MSCSTGFALGTSPARLQYRPPFQVHIGRVDDDIDVHFGDVVVDNGQWHSGHLLSAMSPGCLPVKSLKMIPYVHKEKNGKYTWGARVYEFDTHQLAWACLKYGHLF
jgi:hypothetical protein